MEYCAQHVSLSNDIASIKTSVTNIERQLVQGINFKTAVVGSLVGMLVIMVVQVVTFAFFYGQMSNQVKVNTVRIDVLEKGMPLSSTAKGQ